MKPIKFKEQNCTVAENQPEYLPLPSHKTEDGRVISCWQFSLKERFKILFGKKMWLSISTFNKPLQPLLPSLETPFIKEK